MLGVISGSVVVTTSGDNSCPYVCSIRNRRRVIIIAFKISPVIFSFPEFFIFIFGNIPSPCQLV